MRSIDNESAPSVAIVPSAETLPLVSPDLAPVVDERQLVQSQRLDALAQMAGHVAHEYNNLLTTILGFSGLMRQSNHLTADERDNLRHIDDAAHRAADLTQSLLSFARGGLVSYGSLDVNRLVSETLLLAEPTLGDGIKLHIDLPGTTPFIDGDAGQLQQAILNIIFNARDAMTVSGDLYVTVTDLHAAVQIAIRDSGPGMDDETRRRAFEPFFTRKANSARSGLGLSTAYGIVKGHRGSIVVDSSPGEGTTVEMTFPASTPVDLRIRPSDGDLALIAPVDESTRNRAIRLATSLGLTPIFARDSAHAIELVSSRPHRFATAISAGDDAGREEIRPVLEVHPTLPLLLCVPASS